MALGRGRRESALGERANDIATRRPLERQGERRLDERDRQELVEDLLQALAAHGAADGARLLDLMRAEQNVVEALATIRREIATLVRSAPHHGNG